MEKKRSWFRLTGSNNLTGLSHESFLSDPLTTLIDIQANSTDLNGKKYLWPSIEMAVK